MTGSYFIRLSVAVRLVRQGFLEVQLGCLAEIGHQLIQCLFLGKYVRVQPAGAPELSVEISQI
jgi:hypothetical protein